MEDDEEEEAALRSGSEGTSSEPREDNTDASSVEATSSSGVRPRRVAALRRAVGTTNTGTRQEAAEGRRRSTRSLSAYNQNNNYEPLKTRDTQVFRERHIWKQILYIGVTTTCYAKLN